MATKPKVAETASAKKAVPGCAASDFAQGTKRGPHHARQRSTDDMIADPPHLMPAAEWKLRHGGARQQSAVEWAGLSDDAARHLFWLCARYCDDQRRCNAKAEQKARKRELQAVMSCALRLRDLLFALSDDGREAIDGALGSLILDGKPEMSYIDQSFRVARFMPELVNLLTAVEVAGWGGKSGRPPVPPERRYFMINLAQILRGEAIKPSASRGKFLAICAACYREAGISSGAAESDARALCNWLKAARRGKT